MATSSSERDSDLVKRLRSYAHWHYRYELNDGTVIDVTAGGPGERQRHRKRRDHIMGALERHIDDWSGLRVLDVGCNSGFWCFQALSRGASHVFGFDADAAFIEQAQLLSEHFGYANRTRFEQRSVYDVHEAGLDDVDVTLCLGLLYHLAHPLLALQRIAERTRRWLVVDTAVCPGFDLALLELRRSNPFPAGARGTDLVLIPTLGALEAMIRSCGFEKITRVDVTGDVPWDYASGERVVLVAERSGDGHWWEGDCEQEAMNPLGTVRTAYYLRKRASYLLSTMGPRGKAIHKTAAKVRARLLELFKG